MREYQGERHTVTIVPGRYLWGEATYASLSTIARAITGMSWSGPRFFGLRVRVKRLQGIPGERAEKHAVVPDAGRRRWRGGPVLPVLRKVQQ